MPHARTWSGTSLASIPEDSEATVTSAVDEANIKLPNYDECLHEHPYHKLITVKLLEEKLIRLMRGKEHVRLRLEVLDACIERCGRELDGMCREAAYR